MKQQLEFTVQVHLERLSLNEHDNRQDIEEESMWIDDWLIDEGNYLNYICLRKILE